MKLRNRLSRSARRFYPPDSIPLFPLPETVLFPGERLPLHVFEPRYRRMVRDGLEFGQWVGMALLKPGWESNYEGSPPVHSLLGVGRLVHVTPLPDGRFNVLLKGRCRARVVEEDNSRSYRRALIEPLEEDTRICADAAGEAKRLGTICRLLARQGLLSSVWGIPPRPQAVLGEWCDRIAAHAPLSASEKQVVLEALDARLRAVRLEKILGKRFRGFLSYDEFRLGRGGEKHRE